jgi:PAS domain S-box-containing protein
VKKNYYKSALIILLSLVGVSVCRWGILPYVQKIPTDFSYNANVFSVDNFYDETEKRFSGEILSITKFSYNTIKKDKDGDLLIRNIFEVKKPSGENIFSVERLYAIDPMTGAHVYEKGDTNRRGYLFAPQNIQEKEDFIYWHINYNTPALMRFQGEEVIAGLKVYRYFCSYKADQTKNLGFLPGVPKERGVELEVMLQTWIDPVTGWLIKYEDHTTAWYYDIHTHWHLYPWNKFHNEFAQSSILKQVEVAKNKQQQIKWIKVYIPTSLVLIALLILSFGWFKKKYKKELLPTFTALLIFTTLSGVSFWLYNFQKNAHKEKYLEDFEADAGKTLSYIENKLSNGNSALDVLRYNYEASGSMDRNHFMRLAHHLLIKSDNIRAFGFAPIVKSAERNAYEQLARKEGLADFMFTEKNKQGKLVTARERSVYLPVYFIEPHQSNKKALGYDLLSDSTREVALILAKKTTDLVVTEPIELVQINEPNKRGIIIFDPLFKPDETGQPRLAGYFSGVYLIDHLITSAISSHDLNKEMKLKISDVTTTPEQDVFSSAEPILKNDLLIKKQLPVLNRVWEFNFYLPPMATNWGGIILLITGILFALIASILAYLTLGSKTKELKESNELFLNLFNHNPAAISIQRIRDGITINVNNSFLKLFDLPSKQAIIGKTASDANIAGDPKQAQEIRELLKRDRSVTDFELQVKTSSGAIKWLSTSIVTIEIDNLPCFLSVSLEVTERKKMITELSAAKQIAENAVILKETFLANMSHEIRTPMNAIIGFTDLLLKRGLPSQEKDFVQTIKNSGDNLLRIINDILDVSKINSGMMSFEEHPMSIAEIFSSLNSMLLPKAKEKKLDLLFEYDQNIPDCVLGDPTRLTQIILNLVGNAIKFTKKGSVRVFAKALKEEEGIYHIAFSVKDTGIGIPDDKLKSVFERFNQAESHTTRKYGGTGLGLSIAKQLIDLQGGTIDVSSKVDEGSEFLFQLPFKKTDRVCSNNHFQHQESDIPGLNKLEILLVEDNPINVKFLLTLFKDYDIRSAVAENGKIAIEKMKNNHYDIVLMDIEMPEMNGFEATSLIRNELKNNIPIIALTANAMAGEEDKCLSMGMDDYISKPINSALLFEKMLNAVSLKKATGEVDSKKKRLINLDFLNESLSGKKDAIRETIDLFLEHLPKDLYIINEAVLKVDYATIKGCAHKLKSTMSITGVYDLMPILEEMEMLGGNETDIDKIIVLNKSLNLMCKDAIEEMRGERVNYE